MTKADLFKEAIEKKLIAANSKEKDFTVDQLKDLLNPETETEEKKSDLKVLFDEAVEIKAVPTGSEIKNYTLARLQAIVSNHKKELDILKKQQEIEKKYANKNNK